MLEQLLDRFRQRDRHALARLISLAARGEQIEAIRSALTASDRHASVVAVTGSGGVGKSTLVGKLIEHIRGQGQSVAVLACDPQSPLSGGALLGDRFRMPARADDDGVFIRSLATVSGRGAVAEHLDVLVRLLEAFGFDVVLIETVGAGQGDTAVRDLADAVVLLVQPETGDDLQWEKAGVLEVADVVVIHKADLPGAEQAEAQVRSMLGLSNGHEPPVVRVSSKKGSGIDQLWDAVRACPPRRQQARDDERALLRLAQETLAERFTAANQLHDSGLQQLLHDWQQGRVRREEAVAKLLRLLVEFQESGSLS
jgi:LAO/AO transport system ATPase